MPSADTRDAAPDRELGGATLCLSCGLCCNGTLHSNVPVRPEHVQLVRNLGLTIETAGHEDVFLQPCPLYRKDRCSAYPHHPPSCQQYRCALLRKYENGDITLEDSLTIARTAKELLAGGVDLSRSWDNEHGLRGSGAARQANAELALRAVALDVHLEKHFRLPKKAGDTTVS